MADTAIADVPMAVPDQVRSKKGRSRKALKAKNQCENESNILAGSAAFRSSPATNKLPQENSAGKENHESLSQSNSRKKTAKGASKSKQQTKMEDGFERELREMQEKLEKLKLEKEQAEELLKEREEALKVKEEELETRSKEQEKLQMELQKLQKIKEFKPTMTFPIIETKEQEKKDKGKKGCNEKKRPTSAYSLWIKDHWNEIKKVNPDAGFKEVSNILAEKWKTVSKEEKKPYEERYQAEKEAYLKIIGNEKRENEAMRLLEEEQKQRTAMDLLEQYLQFKQEAEKEDNKKTKKVKDPLKPKQPMSAFFLFLKARRATMPADNKNIVEMARIAGEEWKSMTEKQKAPYEEMAKKNKEIYMQELELYKQKKDDEAASVKKEEEELLKLQKQEALQLLKKKERAENIIKKTKEKRQKLKEEKKNADPNKPKKPASSFLLFSKQAKKDLMKERQGISVSTLNAIISVQWKELSEQDRQMWNDKAAEAMEAYKKELEDYNNSVAKNGDNPGQELP